MFFFWVCDFSVVILFNSFVIWFFSKFFFLNMCFNVWVEFWRLYFKMFLLDFSLLIFLERVLFFCLSFWISFWSFDIFLVWFCILVLVVCVNLDCIFKIVIWDFNLLILVEKDLFFVLRFCIVFCRIFFFSFNFLLFFLNDLIVVFVFLRVVFIV